MCKGKKCKTFICYRGKAIEPDGLPFAESFKYALENLGNFGPVFLADHEATYGLISDLNDIMCDVQDMFLLLRKGFFSDFRNQDGSLNKESITYHELRVALSNENIRIRPVYLDGFQFDPMLKESIRTIFPGLDVDTQLFNYTAIILNSDTSDEEIKTSIVKAKSGLSEYYQPNISQYLRACVDEVLASDKPSDENLMLWENTTDNPKQAIQESKVFITPYFKEPFEKIVKDCHMGDLDKIRFTYWDVFLSESTNSLSNQNNNYKSLNISTCAVCVGALVLHYWLAKDYALVTHEMPQDISTEIEPLIQQAINTIILLRNNRPNDIQYASWASNYDTNWIYPTAGTVNQTTLSISTLIVCGFLDNRLAEDVRINRYRLIMESINWLLEGAIRTRLGTVRCFVAWDYMNWYQGKPATLPTAFCIETIMKFVHQAEKDLKHFAKTETNENFVAELRDLIERSRQYIYDALEYFIRIQNGDGGFKKNLQESSSSITHTSKVLILLCAYMGYCNDDEHKRNRIATMIAQATQYLHSLGLDKIKKLSDPNDYRFQKENFDVFQYGNQFDTDITVLPNLGEQFENSGEMWCVTAIVNVLKTIDAYQKDGQNLFSSISTQKESLLKFAGKILENYSQNCHISSMGFLLVKGKRPEEKNQYPIYLNYYYRMALSDYYEYLKGLS